MINGRGRVDAINITNLILLARLERAVLAVVISKENGVMSEEKKIRETDWQK